MAFHVILGLLTVSVAARSARCAGVTPIFNAIDAQLDGLAEINHEIWSNPELAYQEHHAHEVLTDYLESQGFTVTRGAYNISTAFRAEFSRGEGGRTVSFNAEYDALRGMGHACGHNLIATSSVAAAIGVKEALENQGVEGKVVLLGTPAEEGGSGKVKLLEAGAYEDLDVSLMGHPSTGAWGVYRPTSAAWTADVTFTGVEAHAAGAPFMGRNAMDGFVSAYTMTGLYRQQLTAPDRVHHVIEEDTQLVNVVPGRAHSRWGVRSNTRDRRDTVLRQVRTIFDAAAAGSNTSVEIVPSVDYWDLQPNLALGTFFHENLMSFFDPSKTNSTEKFSIRTIEDEVRDRTTGGSTDQGNVSHNLPAIHIIFPITNNATVHNPSFKDAAGTELAFVQAITTGKILALTGIEVLRNQTLADAARTEFEATGSSA